MRNSGTTAFSASLEAPRWFCLVPLQERERGFANQHPAEGVTDYSRNSKDFCPCLQNSAIIASGASNNSGEQIPRRQLDQHGTAPSRSPRGNSLYGGPMGTHFLPFRSRLLDS
jgi:hypothetical protein